MNRRSLIALASAFSFTVWHKPIISSVILPTHAQTSCSSFEQIDVTGRWLFTDTVGQTVEIEFIDSTSLTIDNRAFPQNFRRSTAEDVLILEVRQPRAPWLASITQESSCIASEITITDARDDGGEFSNGPFIVPLIGTRIRNL